MFKHLHSLVKGVIEYENIKKSTYSRFFINLQIIDINKDTEFLNNRYLPDVHVVPPD